MDVEFAETELGKMDADPAYAPRGMPPEAARGFRKALVSIRAALDERDLYRGGLRMEKLKGGRKDEHSVRLNKQWRLILRLEAVNGRNKAVLLEIVDYH